MTASRPAAARPSDDRHHSHHAASDPGEARTPAAGTTAGQPNTRACAVTFPPPATGSTASAGTPHRSEGTGAGRVVGVGVAQGAQHPVTGEGRRKAARRVSFRGERHVRQAPAGGAHEAVDEVEVDVDER